MCANIIIDRDIASKKFMRFNEYADKKLKEFIENKYFRVIYSNSGSQWAKEITGKWKDRLISWRDQGLATLRSDDLSYPIKELEELDKLKSEDFHILALAQITNTNFLYTDDDNLKKDFKNKEVMKNRKTKLYPFRSNKQVIDKFLNKNKCPNKN